MVHSLSLSVCSFGLVRTVLCLMTRTRGLATLLNVLHWACHSSFCLCSSGGFLSPRYSSLPIFSPSHLLTLWWRCVSQVAHSSQQQEIWLLISDKNIKLFVVQRKRCGWGFTRENLPSPLPTKSRLRPLPSKRNVNQTRAWGLLKRSSSGGHFSHCASLVNGKDNPMCPTDLTLDKLPL